MRTSSAGRGRSGSDPVLDQAQLGESVARIDLPVRDMVHGGRCTMWALGVNFLHVESRGVPTVWRLAKVGEDRREQR